VTGGACREEGAPISSRGRFDCVFIPAGEPSTPIGAGLLGRRDSANSSGHDISFVRFGHRVDASGAESRELHVEESLAVTDYSTAARRAPRSAGTRSRRLANARPAATKFPLRSDRSQVKIPVSPARPFHILRVPQTARQRRRFWRRKPHAYHGRIRLCCPPRWTAASVHPAKDGLRGWTCHFVSTPPGYKNRSRAGG